MPSKEVPFPNYGLHNQVRRSRLPLQIHGASIFYECGNRFQEEALRQYPGLRFRFIQLRVFSSSNGAG